MTYTKTNAISEIESGTTRSQDILDQMESGSIQGLAWGTILRGRHIAKWSWAEIDEVLREEKRAQRLTDNSACTIMSRPYMAALTAFTDALNEEK